MFTACFVKRKLALNLNARTTTVASRQNTEGGTPSAAITFYGNLARIAELARLLSNHIRTTIGVEHKGNANVQS
jgi:hypothetical protein